MSKTAVKTRRVYFCMECGRFVKDGYHSLSYEYQEYEGFGVCAAHGFTDAFHKDVRVPVSTTGREQ